MALLPPPDLRTSLFKLSFSDDLTRDQLSAAITRSDTLSTDGPGQLIADAFAWADSFDLQADDSYRPMMAWCQARDVVGALAAIEDLAFYTDPPLLRSNLDKRPALDLLRDWIDSHANWYASVGRYCATRRRQALADVALDTMAAVAHPAAPKSEPIRRM